jgi:hypothetical protein
MSDNGRVERVGAWLLTHRQATDNFRLRAGIMVAQMDGQRRYGAGVVDELARSGGMHKSTLYEYATVARFLVCWLGLSARRIFETYPPLTYSHLRTAVRLDFETAIDALTPDQFSVYCAELRGKEVALPIFRQAGSDGEVIQNFLRGYRVSGKRIELLVREVK